MKVRSRCGIGSPGWSNISRSPLRIDCAPNGPAKIRAMRNEATEGSFPQGNRLLSSARDQRNPNDRPCRRAATHAETSLPSRVRHRRVLILPAALTLRTVVYPGVLEITSDNPTPAGYAWSLLLFIIPIAALSGWFSRRPDLGLARSFWHRGTGTRWIPSRSAVRQRVFHLFEQAYDTRHRRSGSGRANSGRRICLLSHWLHARLAELYLGR